MWEENKSSAEKAESLGRLATAEAYWYAALEDAQTAFSMTDPRTTSTLECLSECLFRQSKYNLAVPVVAKSLEIFQISLGPDHADVGILLNNLGMLHHLQNNFGDAEKFYQRSMSVLSKALGAEHPEMANLLANYSDLLVRTNRAAEAQQLRQSLTSNNTGRWTRVVVHEPFRQSEEIPQDCVRELGLDYQHKASEIRLKMVQERIKDAAFKQQPPVPDKPVLPDKPARPAPTGLSSVAKLKDPSQRDSISGSGKPSLHFAKLEEEMKQQEAAAAAEAEITGQQKSLKQPEKTPSDLQEAQFSAPAATDEQIVEIVQTVQKPAPAVVDPAPPRASSPLDQLAAGLPQPVIPQFEHLSLEDPSEEKFPPGIVKILASRMNKRNTP